MLFEKLNETKKKLENSKIALKTSKYLEEKPQLSPFKMLKQSLNISQNSQNLQNYSNKVQQMDEKNEFSRQISLEKDLKAIAYDEDSAKRSHVILEFL